MTELELRRKGAESVLSISGASLSRLMYAVRVCRNGDNRVTLGDLFQYLTILFEIHMKKLLCCMVLSLSNSI